MDDNTLMLEHSVIRIIGKDGKTTCGTGFLVAENIAVTCAHVIGIAGAKPGSPVQFKFDGSDEVEWATLDEAHFSPGSEDDVAFILLEDVPAHVTPLPLASAKRSDGHPYKSYGYPAEAEPVKARKPRASINGVVAASEPGVQPLLEVKGEEWGHGLSGAPIFDLSYQSVVGMVTQGKKLEKTQLGYATTSDTICLHYPGIPLDKTPVAGLPPLPPPGELPEPAPLPPGSRMTHPRNNLFTGRLEDLHALAAELLYRPNGKTVALTQPVAAAGMGGIGKTQLAAEFCYRWGQFYEGVHWINAANVDGIGAEIAACGLAMVIQPWSDKQPEQIEATLREWAKSKRRLVVFDNLEKAEAMAEWLPRLSSVLALITTRLVKWPRSMPIRLQSLDFFQRAESLVLLRSLAPRLKTEADSALDELAALLCDLPLAVDLAGRYLDAVESLTTSEYAAKLRSGVLADYSMSENGENEATRHLRSLEASFELSWNELDAPEGTRTAKEMFLARLAFRCAGYCTPAVPIPVEVLHKAARESEDPEGEDKDFDSTFDLGLAHACALGLLERADGGVTIHPLLAEFARGKDASLSEAGRALFHLANTLAKASYRAYETGIPAAFQPLRPHLEVAAPQVEKAFPEKAGTLWNNLGYHLNNVADFAGAKKLYERALAIDERVYGKEHPNVARDANNLGLVLQALGDLVGAKANYERALAIDERDYGKEHPNVAIRANNLGLVRQALGDPARAQAHFEQALAIIENVLGSDHTKMATLANNLGSLLQDLDDLAGAKAHYERALAIDERVYGKEHPNVARDANNLGSLLKDLGDLAGAKVHYERALVIVTKVFGETHPYVASSTNNLGSVLQDLGDLAGAKAHFERALAIGEKVYGPGHPQVAIYAINLGSVLQDLGDLAGAKAHYERALDIFIKFLPENHPNIRIVRENLAVVEEELGTRGETD